MSKLTIFFSSARSKTLVTTLLILIQAHVLVSQDLLASSVHGRILESLSSESMQFVNVVLRNASNDSLIAGTVTDENGLFEFVTIPIGDYLIEVSYVGFETFRTANFSITRLEQKVDLGLISIRLHDAVLDPVEVTAQASTFNFSVDRKIYNVEKDVMSQTGSIADVLQNIPSISVEADGQILLRGTSNFNILINGRASQLLRRNASQTLQQMPAHQLERIEVITNPSAEFRPDGAGGIINLVIKKDVRRGFHGSLLANAGNLKRYNAGTLLNYGTGKVGLSGRYAIKHANSPRQDFDTRIQRGPVGEVISEYEFMSSRRRDALSHLMGFGFNIEFDENTSLEFGGEYFTSKESSLYRADWTTRTELLQTNHSERMLDETEKEYEFSISFEKEFDNEQKLTLDITNSGYDESEDNLYDETKLTPSLDNTISRNLIEKSGPLAEVALEYSYAVEDSEIKSGYLGEFLKDKIHFLGENFSSSQDIWYEDLSRTSQFKFSQTVHAFYSTLKKNFGSFDVSPGVRIEQAFITSELPERNVKIINKYFKVFPSLHLGFEIREDRELRLNYSKRINRPDSDEHNPFAEYDDPRSREVGNPELRPENIHSIELGYDHQDKRFTIIPSIYYRYTYDAFTEIEEIVEDSVLQSRYVNLDNEKAGGLELILVAYPSDDLDLNLSTNIYYNEIDGTNLGFPNKKSAVIWESKLASSYFLTRSTFGQINIAYRSSRLTPQGRHRPRFLVNLGFRQKLWKGKAALVLTISDLFKTLKRERYIDTSELYRKTVQERKTQIFQFGFNYQFGRNDKTNQTLEYEDSL